ncbi:MAG: hypothetical protein B7Z81_09650, partial [Acidocella sp. 20-61-6]
MQSINYSLGKVLETGWDAYQVQLGAGVWPIAALLMRPTKPAGAKVLEIGGAYGFGLDFCNRARGWQGLGYDPSPIADFGAHELGLALSRDYFEEKDLGKGPWDIALATELIEHLERPLEFLALMRQALTEDGILVLTTPAAEALSPAIDKTALLPLLSPGAHLVLQSAKSLEIVLHLAGFTHVVVVREAMSLVGYASRAPFCLSDDKPAARAAYRRYLVERGRLAAPESNARFGFAGRGIFEAANDGDGAAVADAWAVLVPAARTRFGLDLETMTELPAGATASSLFELERIMPLGLGMILFARAMHLLRTGATRATVLPLLRLAGAACGALQGALAARSQADGLTASLVPAIETEILLCQAEAGDAACVAGLLNRDDITAGWRGFVALVNAGAFELAAELKQSLLPEMPGQELDEALRRDALFTLGVLRLQNPQGWALGAALFAQLRAELMQGAAPGTKLPALFWPALRAETLALRLLDREEEAEDL